MTRSGLRKGRAVLRRRRTAALSATVGLLTAGLVAVALNPALVGLGGDRSARLASVETVSQQIYACAARNLRASQSDESAGLLSCSGHSSRSRSGADALPAGAVLLRRGEKRTVTCDQDSLSYARLSRTMVTVICNRTAAEPTPSATPSPTPSPVATTSPIVTTAPAMPATSAPSGGPSGTIAKICDSSSLAGPTTAPAGAITVKPSTNLATLVDSSDGPATYWLAPGVHHFGTGEYDQIGPHSGDVYIGAPGAIVDGQHKNRYAFGGDGANVTLSHLTIQNFGTPGDNGNEGVVNHDSGKNWTIADTTVQANAGAGVMLGTDDKLLRSCLRNNGQYGFNGFSMSGASNITMTGNEISGNNTDDWEKRNEGCGCTGGGKFWEVKGAAIVGNYVHDNRGPGLWADTNNTGFLFQDNYIADNDGEGLLYETSYNAQIVGNTFVRNAIKEGPTNPGFPTSAIYISESGSDSRVAGPYGTSFTIADNNFVDNWAGIIGWENADRFAGSPNNSSTDTTTMVNPQATEKVCGNASLVATKPYFDDCRWKTQNLKVTGNTFSLDPSKVPGCKASAGCGYNGIFSQVGTSPSWSPYQDYIVPDNITFHQNNVWSANTYHGPWRFMAHTDGNDISWDTWRSTYKQDTGSTLS